jgi:integrase
MAQRTEPKRRLLFTDAWLKGLKATGKRIEYADTKERALLLRVGATGKAVFYGYQRIKGAGRIRKALGVYPEKSLHDARRLAEDVRKYAHNGLDLREVERKEAEAQKAAQRLKESRENFDLSGMCGLYVKERETNAEKKLAKKSAKNYRALIRHYLDGPHGDGFRGRYAGDVTALEIREMLKTVAQSSATQANRLFELIRASYRLATDLERLASVPALKRPAKNAVRDRLLSQKEIRAFWSATQTATLIPRARPIPKDSKKAKRAKAKADDERKPISPQARGALRMLLALGQRRGETLAMRWADIDGDIWRIPGQFRKGGRTHTVPLSSLAFEILEELRPVTGDKARVFDGVSATNIHGRAFRAVREAVNKELKTAPFSIHDLRRTFATQSRELCGVKRDALGDVLGHVSGKHASTATRSYDYSTGISGMESALEAWGATLKKIIAGEIIGGEKGKILAFR